MEIIEKIKIMEAAREFGRELAECKENRAAEEARQALEKDSEARELISSYLAAQHSVQVARMLGSKAADELNKLKEIESKLNTNKIVKDLAESQKNLQDMLGSLNAEISGVLGIDFSASACSSC